MLASAGYKVLAVPDGEEAVRLFSERSGEIDLVLLDAVMPKMSGRDVYRQIKTISPQTRVIFCTGYDPETSHAAFIIEKDLKLITKPFDSAVLLRSVREVLDQE